MNADDVRERLGFARKRVDELVQLNAGNLAGADPSERQQLTQEVFFHLVGAIDVLGQLVNEMRSLGVDEEDVSITKLADALRGDPLEAVLRSLYARTRRTQLPRDPYGDDGLIFRIYNYRHQVTHRRRNPFRFQVGISDAALSSASVGGEASQSAHFLLDPRDAAADASRDSVRDDLQRMFALVTDRCERAVALL